MPLFRCNDDIHFFAHVPKCAGQSIESYLEARFGPLAFLDNSYYELPPHKRWNRSSPQHITLQALKRLVPADWISSSFACVRNPYARIVSAYNFASTVNRHVAPKEDITRWLLRHSAQQKGNEFAFDNHLCRQDSLVPEDAAIFRMEDGLDGIVSHLDQLEGRDSGPREIGRLNERKEDIDPALYERQEVPQRFYDAAAELYARDFDRFGYDPGVTPAAFAMVPKFPRNLSTTARALKLTLRRGLQPQWPKRL